MTDSDARAPRGAAGAGNGNAPRKRTPWLTIVPVVVFGVLALVFFYQLKFGDMSDTVASVLIGSPVPDNELAPLEGLTANGAQLPGFSPATFDGEVTLVNVFASWCGPCREEHPFIEELARDDRIRIVGINNKDATSDALAFLQRYGNPYDAVGVDPSGRASIDWGVYGVPETFLVDRNGVIRYKLVGQIHNGNYATVVAEIEAVLAEQPATGAPPPAATPPA
ncbi:MAG: DsbE family thiol:disulfide interchange protein [Bauldia sp.]|nr:DsbE family thiol:disulfide interchange protein [Bauldia sp.]